MHQNSKISGCGFYLLPGLGIIWSKYYLQCCLKYSTHSTKNWAIYQNLNSDRYWNICLISPYILIYRNGIPNFPLPYSRKALLYCGVQTTSQIVRLQHYMVVSAFTPPPPPLPLKKSKCLCHKIRMLIGKVLIVPTEWGNRLVWKLIKKWKSMEFWADPIILTFT